MAEPLVFAPDYLLPVHMQGAVGYREGHEPDAELLERVGFFVPAYIEHPNAGWMARMPRLEVVQLPTVGFDAVVPQLPTGVTLCNAAGVHEQSTAELAVGSIITVWRGLDRAARDMVEGAWSHRRGRSLQQARVVIIGAGGAPVVGQATKSVLIAPAVAPKPTTPSKVRNLKVTGVSTNTVSLNWDAPSDTGASAIAGYVVKWAGPTSGQVSVQANTTNANIGTLTANSSYTFSVLATNLQGWGDPVSVTQNTASTPPPSPTPPPIQQQTLVGPAWEGGGPKVKGGKWKTFNDTANLDTNAGQEARLKAQNKSASIKSVKFRYKGDFVEVRAVLKPGKKKGSFTLHESAPAVPGFTAMAVERKIKVVK